MVHTAAAVWVVFQEFSSARMRALFLLHCLCLEIADFFPHLPVRTVVVVFVGVIQLDRIAEAQDPLLQPHTDMEASRKCPENEENPI